MDFFPSLIRSDLLSGGRSGRSSARWIASSRASANRTMSNRTRGIQESALIRQPHRSGCVSRARSVDVGVRPLITRSSAQPCCGHRPPAASVPSGESKARAACTPRREEETIRVHSDALGEAPGAATLWGTCGESLVARSAECFRRGPVGTGRLRTDWRRCEAGTRLGTRRTTASAASGRLWGRGAR